MKKIPLIIHGTRGGLKRIEAFVVPREGELMKLYGERYVVWRIIHEYNIFGELEINIHLEPK